MYNLTISRKVSLFVASCGLLLASFAATSGVVNATSSTAEISIPVSTVVRNIGVGESKVLETKEVSEYKGMVCSVMATAENQSSVHPGNNLVIASGNTSVTLEDVEREANVSTEANGDLTLGDEVTVSLVMGQHDVFSAGMDVVLTCEEKQEAVYSCDALNLTILDEANRTVEAEAVISHSDNVSVVGTEIDFGGGNVSSENPATYSFESTGEKTVTATVAFESESDSKEVMEATCSNSVEFGEVEGEVTKPELPNTGPASTVATLALLGASTVVSSVYGFKKSRK